MAASTAGFEFGDVVLLFVVALTWGITNPLMRKGGDGVESASNNTSNFVSRVFWELVFLLTNWKYLIPYVINQMGSILFLVSLSTTDLSLAIPFTNALSFVVTAITGRFLGEQSLGVRETVGMMFVVCGVLLCVISKSDAMAPTTTQ